MNYALIEHGMVSNIIWLNERNEAEWPNAVKLYDRLVEVGDAYTDGKFYRDGVEVLTALEATAQMLETANQAVSTYEAAMQVLGVDTTDTTDAQD